jgi:hypothetical protein
MTASIKSLALALSIPLALAGNASAVTALIDFGISNTPTYNSVSMLTAPDTGVVPLFDTMMVSTGWSARVLETGSGNGGNAGAGANATVFPASLSGFETTALQDSIFANQGTGTTPSMVLTFSGLNSAATYNLLLYGSRLNAQGADQRWALTQGSPGAPVTHFSEDNRTTVVDWMGVSPNGSGVIEILIDSPGPDNLGALALNFGSITEVVPEPSSVFLLGLSGLGLLARRRR